MFPYLDQSFGLNDLRLVLLGQQVVSIQFQGHDRSGELEEGGGRGLGHPDAGTEGGEI